MALAGRAGLARCARCGRIRGYTPILMKPCYGYIRVSTAKQGDGVSLQEQRDAIEAFAGRNDLTITEWFEEKQTAAKGGRPTFNRMIASLKTGRAQGLVIHKIDRSARNLRDWAAIGELSDAGIDVYFATETLDFRSRGGRLTADIQAVIAADYIRNLREECKKGIRGRLKQGLYPFKAPVGYLDNGGGKPKTPDPKTAPIIRKLFELYASGQHTYESLIDYAATYGLGGAQGGRLTKCGIETILKNPFYIGLIRLKGSGEIFPGVHLPLISRDLFDRVQAQREGRLGQIRTRHQHLYRRLFRCALCDGPMVPERQKGRVYYRCKTRPCPTKTVREDRIEQAITAAIDRLALGSEAIELAGSSPMIEEAIERLGDQRRALELQIKAEKARIDRLDELLIASDISTEVYKAKRNVALLELARREEELAYLPTEAASAARLRTLAELSKSLKVAYKTANPDEKRELVEILWPNRRIKGRNVELEPCRWLVEAPNIDAVLHGGPLRDGGRTFTHLERLMEQIIGKLDGS